MRFLAFILLLAAGTLAAIHAYFYIRTGSLDACEAAVTRLVQTQREAGRDVAAGLGVIFAEQARELLRTEGVVTCYRTALTGEAPAIEIRIPQ